MVSRQSTTERRNIGLDVRKIEVGEKWSHNRSESLILDERKDFG
jgi:hypothetical protein